MKLKITEEAWGINHRTGKSSVRKTDEKTFDCVAGELPPFETGRRSFTIDEVTEEGITLSVHCANEKYNKTWKLKKGEGAFYRPMSMDGGYQYTFKVK